MQMEYLPSSPVYSLLQNCFTETLFHIQLINASNSKEKLNNIKMVPIEIKHLILYSISIVRFVSISVCILVII